MNRRATRRVYERTSSDLHSYSRSNQHAVISACCIAGDSNDLLEFIGPRPNEPDKLLYLPVAILHVTHFTRVLLF